MATKRPLEDPQDNNPSQLKRQHISYHITQPAEPTVTLTMSQLESIIQQRLNTEVQKIITGYYGSFYPPLNKEANYIN